MHQQTPIEIINQIQALIDKTQDLEAKYKQQFQFSLDMVKDEINANPIEYIPAVRKLAKQCPDPVLQLQLIDKAEQLVHCCKEQK